MIVVHRPRCGGRGQWRPRCSRGIDRAGVWNHDIEGARPSRRPTPHLIHEMVSAEGLIGDHEILAHDPPPLLSVSPLLRAEARLAWRFDGDHGTADAEPRCMHPRRRRARSWERRAPVARGPPGRPASRRARGAGGRHPRHPWKRRAGHSGTLRHIADDNHADSAALTSRSDPGNTRLSSSARDQPFPWSPRCARAQTITCRRGCATASMNSSSLYLSELDVKRSTLSRLLEPI